MKLLDEYMGELSRIIAAERGTVDRYLGDAILAFWDEPAPRAEHAVRACTTALRCRARLRELAATGPALSVRIGIGTGDVTVERTGAAATGYTVPPAENLIARRLERSGCRSRWGPRRLSRD